MRLENRHHRLLIVFADPIGYHRGEMDHRVGHTGRVLCRKPLEVADEGVHLALVERVPGHDQVEDAAVRVPAHSDRSGQRGIVVGGSELAALQRFRQPLTSGLGHVGAHQWPTQVAPVGRQGDHRALERPDAAVKVAADAGEHGAVHRDIALDRGPHGLAIGIDALVVHSPTWVVRHYRRDCRGRFFGRYRYGGERHGRNEKKKTDPSVDSIHHSPPRIFSSSAMRSAVETSPSILTHWFGAFPLMKVNGWCDILFGI